MTIVITDTLRYRAVATRAAIRLHKNTGLQPQRGVTITKLFAIATEYTGKKYKRGQHDLAIADLDAILG